MAGWFAQPRALTISVNWTRDPACLGFPLGLLSSQRGASSQDEDLAVRPSGGFLEAVPWAGPVLGLRLHAQQVAPRLVLLEWLGICVEEGSKGQQDRLVMSV